MSARGKGAAVDGVLLLDKPRGISSHTAVSRARRLLGAAKAGHTGTLDPMATGLLPVCFGEATKFSHLLLDADKAYRATIRLGLVTTTGDLEGDVLERRPVRVERRDAERALERFRGEIEQVPPMYSALKHGGRPLYKLAREGKVVERVARRISIRRLELLDLEGEEMTVAVACSKGTYVRVLAEDIGRELGCGGCLSALRREAVGTFELDGSAVTLDALEAMGAAERLRVLLPADSLVATLPSLHLDAGEARRVQQGRQVERTGTSVAGLARIYGPGEEFLGVVEVGERGLLVPRRLKSQAETA